VTTVIDHHVALATIRRLQDGVLVAREDELAIEEPLEIRVDGEPLAVTMRTPGDDAELAVGFLAGEGLIASHRDVATVGPTQDLAGNVVEVRTRSGLRRDVSGERRFHISSSCGICGKGGLEFVQREAPPPAEATPLAPGEALAAPDALRREQSSFARTGGLHATALFEPSGAVLAVREDVGRHNAMDKAIGALLLAGRFPLPGVFACVSGRVSFELVQKAALAGLAGLVAVGAPTSLAVDLARERGLLLCGFTRGGSLNVYSGMLME
jgi:FdhD protein